MKGRYAFPEGAMKGVRPNQYFHQNLGLMNKEKDLINGLPPTINNKHYCSTKERYFLSLARSKSHSSQYFRGCFIWTDVWVGTYLP